MTTVTAADYPPQIHAQAVRDGISEAIASDRLLELIGEFNFGGGDGFPRETVVVPDGLTIRGNDGTKIIGGGASAYTVAWGEGLAMDGGAFKVSSGAAHGGNHQVIISQIAFSGWKGAAILVDSCNGLTIENCRFSEPCSGIVQGFNALDGAPIQNVNAVWAIGAACRGKFNAKTNACDLTHYADGSAPVDDEQFLACFATNFEQIRIDGNNLVGNDDGIEVVFNNLHGEVQSQVHIVISNNELTLDQQYRPRWAGSGGIVCCRNDGAKVDIVANSVTTTGMLGAGMVLSGDYLLGSARKMTVSGNRIDQQATAPLPPFAAIIMGYDLPFGANFPGAYKDEKIGASLSGATIKDNHLTGTVTFGYLTLDGAEQKLDPCKYVTCEPNQSHHIFIEDYGPVSGECQLYLACGTHDIEVRGNFERKFICNSKTNKLISEAVIASPQLQPTPA